MLTIHQRRSMRQGRASLFQVRRIYTNLQVAALPVLSTSPPWWPVHLAAGLAGAEGGTWGHVCMYVCVLFIHECMYVRMVYVCMCVCAWFSFACGVKMNLMLLIRRDYLQVRIMMLDQHNCRQVHQGRHAIRVLLPCPTPRRPKHRVRVCAGDEMECDLKDPNTTHANE